MAGRSTGDRVSAVERIIPRPPDDIAPMRTAFVRTVSKQWQVYLPQALAGCGEGMAGPQFAKGRFIGKMYARACYSMLLVSQRGPISLRALLRASALLPPSRGLTIALGSALLAGMQHLLPKAVHRQLLLTSALMGMLDVLLDDAASSGAVGLARRKVDALVSVALRQGPVATALYRPHARAACQARLQACVRGHAWIHQ